MSGGGALALLAWFDPRGRLSRRAYARLILRIVLVSAALLCLAITLGAQGFREWAFAAVAGIAVVWLASLAQTIRRLHDRDRTGWWLLPSLVLTALSFLPVETQAEAHPVAVVAYTLATLAVSLWLLVETLGRSGTPGDNRHGAEPTKPDPPSAAARSIPTAVPDSQPDP